MNYFSESIKSGLNEYYKILNQSLDTLTENELIWKPNLHSNNIIFLVWHMALIEDNLVNKVLLKNEKFWIVNNYYEKYPCLKNQTGFGFSQQQLDKFPKMDIQWLIKYYDFVRDSTNNLLEKITEHDLSLNYILGVNKVTGFFVLGRLITELNQHLGQISYLRGMIRGLNK